MALQCTICGTHYYPYRHDYLGVCDGCLPNLRAQVVSDPHDAMQVDEDLATRLLLEQAMDEAQRLAPLQGRVTWSWR